MVGNEEVLLIPDLRNLSGNEPDFQASKENIARLAQFCASPDFSAERLNITADQKREAVLSLRAAIEKRIDPNICRDMAVICTRVAPEATGTLLAGLATLIKIAHNAQDASDAQERQTRLAMYLGYFTEEEIDKLCKDQSPNEQRRIRTIAYEVHETRQAWEVPRGKARELVHFHFIGSVGMDTPGGAVSGNFGFVVPVGPGVVEKVIRGSAYDPILASRQNTGMIPTIDVRKYFGPGAVEHELFAFDAVGAVRKRLLIEDQIVNELAIRLLLGDHRAFLNLYGIRTVPNGVEDIQRPPFTQEKAERVLEQLWRTHDPYSLGLFLEQIPEHALEDNHPCLTAFRSGGIRALRDTLLPHAEVLSQLAKKGLVFTDKPSFVCYQDTTGRWVAKIYDLGLIKEYQWYGSRVYVETIREQQELWHMQAAKKLAEALVSAEGLTDFRRRIVQQQCDVYTEKLSELFLSRRVIESFPRASMMAMQFSILDSSIGQTTTLKEFHTIFDRYENESGFPKKLVQLWRTLADTVNSDKEADVFVRAAQYEANLRHTLFQMFT